MVFALKVRRDRAPVKSTCATLAARAVLMAMVACGGACVGFGVVCFCVCVEIHALGRDASQTGAGGARVYHTLIIHPRTYSGGASDTTRTNGQCGDGCARSGFSESVSRRSVDDARVRDAA